MARTVSREMAEWMWDNGVREACKGDPLKFSLYDLLCSAVVLLGTRYDPMLRVVDGDVVIATTRQIMDEIYSLYDEAKHLNGDPL